MIVRLNKTFRKQVQNLKPAQRRRLQAAFHIFNDKPQHSDLYNHELAGRWQGHRSISFGGDWRAHYKQIDNETALFVAVGTHSQLYK